MSPSSSSLPSSSASMIDIFEEAGSDLCTPVPAEKTHKSASDKSLTKRRLSKRSVGSSVRTTPVSVTPVCTAEQPVGYTPLSSNSDLMTHEPTSEAPMRRRRQLSKRSVAVDIQTTPVSTLSLYRADVVADGDENGMGHQTRSKRHIGYTPLSSNSDLMT